MTREHFLNVCKPGHGVVCCAFALIGPDGPECAKGTEHEATLRDKARKGQQTARGNNCSGPPDYKPLAPAERSALQ